MKKAIFISTILAALAFVSVSITYAQGSGHYKANIPFDFSVGKKQFPAGIYNVEIRGTQEKYFVFRDARGKGAYIVNTSPGKEMSDETAALDFMRIGNGYYLRSIQALDRTSSLPIFTPADGLAQNQKQSEVKVLLGRGK
jgi:hypothetical protein